MEADLDLVVRDARLVDREGRWDIGVRDGAVAEVAERVHGRGRRELAAAGMLVSPTFVEPHIHLDKAFLVETAGFNREGTLAEALRMTQAAKPGYTVENVRARAERAIALYLNLGASVFRAHVDVDVDGGLVPLQGVLAAREAFRGLADVQVVAFPHRATLRDPESHDLLVAALDAGADVLGGFPDVELSPENGRRHLDDMLALAGARGVALDVHLDEGDDPHSRFLEYLAARTIEEGMQGRVTASHACALSSYPPGYRQRVVRLLRQAGIGVVVCPQTNLIMGGRYDEAAPRRGMAPAKELLASGVPTAYGQDNMQDMFCPFGCGDTLQNGLVTALAGHLAGRDEIAEVFRMGTEHAASILGLKQYGIAPGNPADLVVLAAASAFECILYSPPRLWVLKRGRVVAGDEAESERDARLGMTRRGAAH